MNAAYHNQMAVHGATLITHIALFDDLGAELDSAGYERQAVTWTRTDNELRPNADLVFVMAAGDVVAEWRGFSASTGGTDYGGKAVTERTYANPGTYSLLAASTGIDHEAGA